VVHRAKRHIIYQPKAKPAPIEKNILDHVKYRVVRYNDTQVDIAKPHEFHGTERTYFKTLKPTKERTFFTAFKKGWVRLYFDDAVHLRKIILDQATVHGALFDGNSIKIKVQDEHFKWHTIFLEEKKEVAKPVTIDEKKLPKLIKSIRVYVRSSSPLTLGPIHLIE